MLLGRQRRQEGFKGSSGRRGGLRAAYCLIENLQESARQVAKGHAARPPMKGLGRHEA